MFPIVPNDDLVLKQEDILAMLNSIYCPDVYSWYLFSTFNKLYAILFCISIEFVRILESYTCSNHSFNFFVLPGCLGAKKLVSDLPVECSVCGVILRQSRNLRRHMELIHFKVGPKLPRGRRSLKGKSLMSLELNTADNVSNSEQNDDPLAVSESEVKLCISSNEAQTSPMVHSAIVSPEPSSSHSMSQSPHPSPAQIIHTSRSSSTDQNHSPLPTHVLTAPVVTQQIRPHLITPQMYQIPTSAQSQIEIHHTQNAPVTICDSLQTTFIPTQAMTFTTQDSNTFRQQNEILRGALYSDTREHCQTE